MFVGMLVIVWRIVLKELKLAFGVDCRCEGKVLRIDSFSALDEVQVNMMKV